jgi:hypothetical protein
MGQHVSVKWGWQGPLGRLGQARALHQQVHNHHWQLGPHDHHLPFEPHDHHHHVPLDPHYHHWGEVEGQQQQVQQQAMQLGKRPQVEWETCFIRLKILSPQK